MPNVWLDPEMYNELNLWRLQRSSSGHHLTVHLFTNPTPTINDDIDCTALTEPTFPGYAAAQIATWSEPAEDEPSAHWFSTGTTVQFCRTTAGATQTVYGVYLTREEDDVCVMANLAWPDGIEFSTECDCYQVTVTKTERDEVVVT